MPTQEDCDDEEFAPLFDYSHVRPGSIDCLRDDDSDCYSLASHGYMKRKNDGRVEEKVKAGQEVADILHGKEVGSVKKNNDDENDWLPPPPKVPKVGLGILGDKSLQDLRSAKQDLASLTHSAKDLIKSLTEPGIVEIREEKSAKQGEREKIIISIQDKGGRKQFCMYAFELCDLHIYRSAESLLLC